MPPSPLIIRRLGVPLPKSPLPYKNPNSLPSPPHSIVRRRDCNASSHPLDWAFNPSAASSPWLSRIFSSPNLDASYKSQFSSLLSHFFSDSPRASSARLVSSDETRNQTQPESDSMISAGNPTHRKPDAERSKGVAAQDQTQPKPDSSKEILARNQTHQKSEPSGSTKSPAGKQKQSTSVLGTLLNKPNAQQCRGQRKLLGSRGAGCRRLPRRVGEEMGACTSTPEWCISGRRSDSFKQARRKPRMAKNRFSATAARKTSAGSDNSTQERSSRPPSFPSRNLRL